MPQHDNALGFAASVPLEQAEHHFKSFARARVLEIQDAVAKACEVDVVELTRPDYKGMGLRKRGLVYPRHLAMWLCRYLLGAPYVEIGKSFGGRDHSTVMNGIKNCDNFCSKSAHYEMLRAELFARLQKSVCL